MIKRKKRGYVAVIKGAVDIHAAMKCHISLCANGQVKYQNTVIGALAAPHIFEWAQRVGLGEYITGLPDHDVDVVVNPIGFWTPSKNVVVLLELF